MRTAPDEVGRVDEGAVRAFFSLFSGKPGKAIAVAAFGWDNENKETAGGDAGSGSGSDEVREAKPSTSIIDASNFTFTLPLTSILRLLHIRSVTRIFIVVSAVVYPASFVLRLDRCKA